ncbi:MAG: NUDIX hydrolase [Geminicoccaceae bacterium]
MSGQAPKHCSLCASPLAWRVPDGDDRERAVCPQCGTVHYENPRPVVGAVCVSAEHVLLCRRAIEPRLGYWTIPAGYMELHESVEEGVRREAYEEARADIELTGLMAVYSIPRISQIQLLYRARLRSKAVSAGPESSEVALTAWDAIPWDELAFPSVHWVLEHARHHCDHARPLVPTSNPTRPVEFAGMTVRGRDA